jgi:hypothetical protein
MPRAIAGIRKQSAAIADHLSTTILYGGNGCWYYDGDHLAWEVGCGNYAAEEEEQTPCDENHFDPKPTAKRVLADVETLRAKWIGENKALPPGGRCSAERSCPYPAVIGGRCRDHHRTMLRETERVRGNVFRQLMARIDCKSAGAKSLGMSRPAYTNRDVFRSKAFWSEESSLERNCTEAEVERNCSSPKTSEGDDREASDFE